MMDFIFLQLEFILRLLVAGLCGSVIGYERNSRLKEAGIRTHLIVCLASALMMLVSKYGFNDVLGPNIKLDPARIANGIVTGIGFLGAGMIFAGKTNQNIRGLTTAAGIWATVGIGMAVGSGMYILGICGAALIVIAQIVLHKNFHWLKIPTLKQISLRLRDVNQPIETLKTTVEENHLEIINIHIDRKCQGFIDVEMLIKSNEAIAPDSIILLFQDEENLISIDI